MTTWAEEMWKGRRAPAEATIVEVRISPPPDVPIPPGKDPVVVARASYARGAGETRIWDLHDGRGRMIVDLPLGTRFQLRRDVPIEGRFLVDDGVKIHRVERAG